MVLSNKEWLDKMDEIIAAIQNNGGDSKVIMDMLSNMWSSSVTYNVGDYVLYNNNIWKCLVQNSNIAPTEGSTWTKVIITNEISTLNSNLIDGTANHKTSQTLLSAALTTNNKQIISSETKNVYVGNTDLEQLYFQLNGKSYKMTDIISKLGL